MLAVRKGSFTSAHKAPIWLLTLLLAAGCSGGGVDSGGAGRAPRHIRLTGQAMGGRQPIVNSTVVVYEAGTTPGAEATQLGWGLTNSSGSFNIVPDTTPTIGAIIYFTAKGGDAGGGVNSAIELMTVAGPYCEGAGCNFPAFVNIDELTTAASAAAMQHFMDFLNCSAIPGNTQTGTCVDIRGAVALVRHAATVNNLINVANGQGSAFMAAQPDPSPIHTTLETLNTLGNILAACVNSSGPGSTPCVELFAKTGPSEDTLLAAFEIASSPVINQNQTLFDLAPPQVIYSPPLALPPSNWTVGGPVYAYAITPGLCGCESDIALAWAYVVDQFNGALLEVSGSPFAAVGYTQSIAVDPTGKFAYIANDDHVAGYAIDPATGTLTEVSGSPFTSGTSFTSPLAAANRIAVDPTGKFVYVANYDTNDVSGYTINSTTGFLTQIAGSAFPAGTNPSAVAIDPTGRFAYVPNSFDDDVSEYTIDSSTGALSQIGSPVAADLTPDAVAVNPTGEFAYVTNFDSDNVSVYTIDSATGALKEEKSDSPIDSGTSPVAVTVDPTGQFVYVTNFGNVVDPGSVSAYSIITFPPGHAGALNPIVGSPFSAGFAPDAVAVELSGRFAYAANFFSGDITAYDIVTAVGALNEISVVSPFSAGTNPLSIAVDPTGKFAYVANFGSSDLSAFMVDPPTGALSPATGSPFSVGGTSTSVAVDPTGKFAYVTNSSTNAISAYAIDPATGTLGPAIGSLPTGSLPNSATVDPTGKFAYVANHNSDNVSAYTIDPSSGALTSIGDVPAGVSPDSVAVDPTGKFAYVANSGDNTVSAYTIAPGTGALTQIGSPVAAHLAPVAVTVDPTGGFAYVANADSNDVSEYTINSTTGALAPIGGSPVSAGASPNSVTVDPSGQFAYVANFGDDTVSAYTINSVTGVLTGIGPTSAGSAPVSVAVDPTGQYVYVANFGDANVSVYTIDPGSGALAPILVSSPFIAGFPSISLAIGP